MTKRREFHHLANIFPMLAGDAAKALAHDISEHGLREPITLLEGKILDGRNRYIACLDVGVEPRFTPYRGDNPAAYVVSLNLRRRHLDESQRAMVAKKLATLEHGQRQTGKFAGVTTQAEAASMLNVSERSVRTAGAVIDKAVPEIVTAVENGDVSVSAAAQFAKLPKEEQAEQIADSATPADAVKAFRGSRQIRLAEAVGDDGPQVVHISDFKVVTPLCGAVTRFADFCRASPATSVAAGMLPSEINEVHVGAAVIYEWLDRFTAALARVDEAKAVNRCQESSPGVGNVSSSGRQITAAASSNANYPDLPPFLDRRGEEREEAAVAAAAPAGRSRLRTKKPMPIPEDFILTSDRAKFAIELKLDAEVTFKKFRAWARSSGKRLTCWDDRWDLWCARDYERNHGQSPYGQQPFDRTADPKYGTDHW